MARQPKEYLIIVGDRCFATRRNRNDAAQIAKDVSAVYTDKLCRVTHKNWNTVKGVPSYINGKEVE